MTKVFEDPAYRKFLAFVQANPELAALPKLYGYPVNHVGEDRRHRYYTVRMEKLKPLRGFKIRGVPEDTFVRNMETLLYGATEPDKLAAENRLRPTEYETVLALNEFIRSDPKIDLDIHSHNMMLRPSDGTIVITDPFL